MRLRTPITLGVLVVVLVGGTFFGWKLATQAFPSLFGNKNNAACQNQQITKGGRLRTGQVTVNVYNRGTISGLASDTMATLARRGFVQGAVGNSNSPRISPRHLTILARKPKSPEVRLVAKQFHQPFTVRKPVRGMAAGISVAVGNQGGQLQDKAPRFVPVRRSTTVCVPAPSATP
ncbi:MAG: LytR C-terminal domain-containing protein [Nocardioidaceae bacterium]